MKLRPGFTLVEAAIAGGILLIGVISLAMMTRTVLDQTVAGDPNAVQPNAVIEQYLRAQVESVKANRWNSANPVPLAPMVIGNGPSGTASLYAVITQASASNAPGGGTNSGNGAIQYYLKEFDVTIYMASVSFVPASDPVMAHTRFWTTEENTVNVKLGL